VPAIRDGASQEVAGLVFAAVVGVYGLIWWSIARDVPDRKPKRQPYGEVLRSGWDLYRLSFFYFVTFGGFVAMAIFLPKLLTDWFDYSLTDAGLRAAGFTIVATGARPIGGWLADRMGGTRVLAISFVGVGIDAIGLSWQASDPSIIPVTVFCLTMAAFLGLGNGAVFKLVPTFFPHSTGAATGIVGAAGGLGGFFPPLVLGIVKDATGEFVLGFVFLVAFAWMSAGMAVAMLDPHESEPAGGAAL
jgi:NNP family nitrate/nitrite transporter-like MFS transporter